MGHARAGRAGTWRPQRASAAAPARPRSPDGPRGAARALAAWCSGAPDGPAAAAQAPLIGFIGRLDFQKGADLVLAVVPWLMQQGVQLVCLGTGDPGLEARGRPRARRAPAPAGCLPVVRRPPPAAPAGLEARCVRAPQGRHWPALL